MKRFHWLLIFLILLIPIFVYSQGSITETVDDYTGEGVKIINLEWTSTGGSVSSTATVEPVDGFVFRVVTVPGTPAPKPLYDITLTDSDGFDILDGQLLNRHASNTEQVWPIVFTTSSSLLSLDITTTTSITHVPRFVKGSLNLYIISSSTSSQGTVKIFINKVAQ